jgi:small subunit ribosomal protein S6
VGTYEIVAVLRPDLDEEALGAALARISQRITEQGGSVTSLERWGKRKLAYPVKKHRDGYYALLVFTLEATRIASLRQVLGLNEDLLRFTLATHRVKPVPAAAASTAAQPAPATAASAPQPATATGPGAPAGGASAQPPGQTTPSPDVPHV